MELLSNNSKIDNKSKKVLSDLKEKVIDNIINYTKNSIKIFESLNQNDYNLLIELFSTLKENTYKPISENEDLYLISKKWVDKAYDFLKDYQKVQDNKNKEDYFKIAFNYDYIYYNYFDELKNKEKFSDKNKYKYIAYPGPIDNYEISDWNDNWEDPENEDENNYIKPNRTYSVSLI